MAIEKKDGIAYSIHEGAGRLFLSDGVATFGSNDGGMYKAPSDVITDYSTAIWSKWGVDNLLPYELADHLENCGVLNAALDAKARMAVGKGYHPFLLVDVKDGEEVLEWVDDSEILDWLEDNNLFNYAFDSIFDKCGYGWNTGSFMLNAGRNRINRIRRIDVFTARQQKMSTNGIVKSILTSNNWNKIASTAFDKELMAQIPALEEGNELADLQSRSGGFEFAFINRKRRNGRLYYPQPLWYAARAWIKVARSVPAFKNAMFANQITLKYVISISEKYFESVYGNDWKNGNSMDSKKKQSIRDQKYDEVDKWLTGEEKAFKSISSGNYIDPVTQKETPFISIQVIDDKVKDGKLLPESSAANSEILFALMTNPALIGAGQPGGPYSNNAGGSNIREAYLTQIMLSEPERKEVTDILNIVKRFNGWDKRLEVERTMISTSSVVPGANTNKKIKPRLVFRNLNGVLTTLDTGGSTKGQTT